MSFSTTGSSGGQRVREGRLSALQGLWTTVCHPGLSDQARGQAPQSGGESVRPVWRHPGHHGAAETPPPGTIPGTIVILYYALSR